MSRPETCAISFRLRADVVDALERLTKATDRPRSWHIEQALNAYLDLQAWQVAQVERSIAEMEAGRGVPHEAVEKELRNWGKSRKAEPAE